MLQSRHLSFLDDEYFDIDDLNMFLKLEVLKEILRIQFEMFSL